MAVPSTTPATRRVQPAGEPRTRHMGAGHLPTLDGLRGVAILAVLASHLFQVNYQGKPLPVRLIGVLFYYGWMGVDLFFVLSGFLITGILVDSREDPGYFRKFYMRRVLRIAPLYYGALLLVLVLTPWLHVRWNGLGWPLVLYGQNLLRYQPLTEQMGPNVSMNHLWSLAIEEQFYLLWPVLVYFLRVQRRVVWAAVVGSVLALCFRMYVFGVLHNGFTTHFSMFARADALLLGGLAAMLYRGTRWEMVLRWALPVFLVTGGFVVFSLLRSDLGLFARPMWQYAVRYSVVAVACAALLVCALRDRSWWAWLLGRRGLRLLGKYSYGIYVLHMLFLPLLSRTFRGLYGRAFGKMVAVPLTAASVFVAACMAAWLSYHLYEKRFLRLKRFFDYQPQAR